MGIRTCRYPVRRIYAPSPRYVYKRQVLDTGVIYPAPPHKKIGEAKALLKDWVARYGIEIIAIGNGTASHETEVFASELLKELAAEGRQGIAYMVVSLSLIHIWPRRRDDHRLLDP